MKSVKFDDDLPKVGDAGLAIHHRRRRSDWEFDDRVAAFMREHGIQSSWFQCYGSDGWRWFHGIVELRNGRAVITQIG